MKHYDVVIIGSGAANIIQEEALAQGLHVAQIERGKWGGTCLTRGCIPTKVMTVAADRLLEIGEGAAIGITADSVQVDFARIKERVWQKINDSIALRDAFAQTKNLTLYEGTASFVSDHELKITYPDGKEERISGDKIFIGTGGRTNVPQVPGLEEAGYLTTESFFGEQFPNQPYESLIIVGGGAIATEFAHIFSALGTKVDIVQRNVRLLPKEDPESSAVLLESFRKRGIGVHLNSLTQEVRTDGIHKTLMIEDKTTKERTELSAQEILIAPGIVSTADWLHLENTSIELDDRGWIKTNEFLETTAPHVYAFGDINGKQQLRHKANYEADILAHNHFMNKQPHEYRWARYDLIPAVTYTYPQVAHVGMTEQEAIDRGHRIKVGKNPYSETAKGFALGILEPSEGFAKLIVDRDTDEMLGIHAVGYEASVLIQPFLNLMSAGENHLTALNEAIGSDTTRALRAQKLTRNLDPKRAQTVRETLVPHPALSEVGIWTYYHFEER